MDSFINVELPLPAYPVESTNLYQCQHHTWWVNMDPSRDLSIPLCLGNGNHMRNKLYRLQDSIKDQQQHIKTIKTW